MKIGESILATLRYSDYFSYPLTFDEIYSRLIAHKLSKKDLKKHLSLLVKNKKIRLTRSFYHLPSHADLAALRLSRKALSSPLLSKANSLAKMLAKAPGVLAIYLTGSLAVANTDGQDDIDFMIITENGKLWTTRFLLTLYSTALGLRRTPSSHNNVGKLCLNLYLTPNSYDLPLSRRSLYTAYELIQAVPLYDPYDTHSHLLAANSWLLEYLPNFPLSKLSYSQSSSPINPLEKFLYWLQKTYMQKRLTREYVTISSAFFHPHNPGLQVLRQLSL